MQRDQDTHGFHATRPGRTALAVCLTVLLALSAGSAAFAQSEAVAVTSSTNADIVVVTLQPVEGGGFTRDGEPFSGGLVALENGSTYLVTLAADGTWTAAYQQVTLSVPLNALESVDLTRLEDGNFALPDGQQVTLATRYTTPSGRTYGVEIGADGLPRPVFVPLRVTVDLGRRGSVELTRGEDLDWAIGDMKVASGDLYEGPENALTGQANRYRLTLEEGRWTAEYEADEVPIAGTELVARPREDGRGYAVGEASLPVSGRGDLSVAISGGEATYHVWATEDGLAGARFDKRIRGPVYAADIKGNAPLPALTADDRSTAANELRTQVTAAGANFPVEDLLGSGQAQVAPERTLREQVRAEIAKLRGQVRGLVDLANDDGLDQATLSRQLVRKWNEADRQVDRLFGSADSNDDSQPDNRLERVLSSSRIVGAFDALLEALETEEAFVQASAGDGGGVYAFAGLGAAAAQRTYAAREWTAEAVFGALGETRYGVATRQRRANAQAANAQTQYLQAFAWATTDSVWRASDVEVRGNAYYTGSTLAADRDGAMYSGDVALQVRFARQRVSGLVSNLMTEDGTAWSYGLGGDVVNISLPAATMNSRGQWTGRGSARLSYGRRAGGARDQMVDGARFQGRLLGTGAAAGGQAVGTWQLGEGTDNVLLAGGFGAVRGPDQPEPTQPLVDDVTTTATTVTRVATNLAPSASRVFTEEQIRVDGSRFNALAVASTAYTADSDGLAEARAAIRAAASPMVLSDADADRIIRVGAQITGEGALTAATFTGWTVDTAGARRAFEEAVKPSDRTARTWFLPNSNTLRAWPLSFLQRTDPFTGESYAGNHPVGSGDDPRQWSSVGFRYFRFDLGLDTLFSEGYPVPETTDTLTRQATDVFAPSGTTHVELARTEIERLGRVLRSVIALDSAEATDADRKFTNDRRQSLFTQIQEQLTGEIFGGEEKDLGIFGSRFTGNDAADQADRSPLNAPELWSAHVDYPVNAAGQAQDSQVLADIDAVIAALQSQQGLERAFQRGGIFAGQDENRKFMGSLYGKPDVTSVTVTADNYDDLFNTLVNNYLTDFAATPFTAAEMRELLLGSRVIQVAPAASTLPISHIWNKTKTRALLVTDTTDFARFGKWAGNSSAFAMDNRNPDFRGPEGFYERATYPEPFAYSPLEQVKYRSAADSAAPTGLEATYRGRSVASQATNFMTADAEARVSWSDSWSADADPKIGELKLTISNIETRGDSLALRFGLADYRSEVSGDYVDPRPGTFDVRALVFRADIMVDSDQDNAVMFASGDDHKAEVVIDTLTGQPQWLDPDDFEINLLDASGNPTGRLLYDNSGAEGMFTHLRPNDFASAWYTQVGSSGHFVNWSGSKVREAVDHFFSRGDGAGKMNVAQGVVDLSADVAGKFVGRSVDGPLAAIGTWALTSHHNFISLSPNEPTANEGRASNAIVGSFGLDLVPTP